MRRGLLCQAPLVTTVLRCASNEISDDDDDDDESLGPTSAAAAAAAVAADVERKWIVVRHP